MRKICVWSGGGEKIELKEILFFLFAASFCSILRADDISWNHFFS